MHKNHLKDMCIKLILACLNSGTNWKLKQRILKFFKINFDLFLAELSYSRNPALDPISNVPPSSTSSPYSLIKAYRIAYMLTFVSVLHRRRLMFWIGEVEFFWIGSVKFGYGASLQPKRS